MSDGIHAPSSLSSRSLHAENLKGKTTGAQSLLGSRRVEVQSSGKSHLSSLKHHFTNFKSLFQRKVSAPAMAQTNPSRAQTEAPSAKKSAEASLALWQQPGLRAGALLQDAHQSAVILSHAGKEAANYHQDYVAGLKEGVSKLDDRALLQLHGKLNSREAQNLRSGLHLLGTRGVADNLPTAMDAHQARAMQNEVDATSRRVDKMDRTIREEMRSRGMGHEERAHPKKWEAFGNNKKTENILKNFVEKNLSGMTADGGAFPEKFQTQMREDFAVLAKEAPQVAARLKEGDSSSKKLAVADIFLTDAMRQTMTLDEGKGAPPSSLKKMGIESGSERQNISDAMVSFCGGNEEQALRLSNITNQKGLFKFYTIMMNQDLVRPPYEDLERGSPMIGSADHDFALKREEGGAVRIEARMRLSIKYVQGQTGALKSIDENKSSMQANFVARLPAEAGAPAELLDMHYASHLRAAPSGNE